MTTRRTSRLYLTISQVFMSLCIGLTLALIVTKPAAAQEPSPSPSPSPNLRARTDPWAQLTPEEKKQIETVIDVANSSEPGFEQDTNRQTAIDVTVEILKGHGEDYSSIDFGPHYNPNLQYDDGTPAEGVTGPTEAGEILVFIGPAAFDLGSASLLQTTIEHERVHAEQFQDDPDAAKAMGKKGQEKEAYTRELEEAQRTGLTQAQKADIQERLNQTIQDPPGAVQRTDALRLSIVLSQHTIPFGRSVPLYVTLHNTSDKELHVNARFAVDDPRRSPFFHELTLIILAPNGEQIEYPWNANIGAARQSDIVELEDEQCVGRVFDLARIYNLTQRGTYYVTAVYQNVSPLALQVGPIRSNTAVFEIQ